MIDTRFRVVVVAGPARSGVTTTAYAVAGALVRDGRRVGVVLVDPSPSLEAMAEAQPSDMWCERLDVAATFERLVRAVADDDRQAVALLENPLYGTLTASLPGAGDFTLLERMAQLRDDDRFDVLVVDTPPSLPSGEFVTASERVKGFLGHPVYRALSVGQRAFGRVADAALSSFLGEVKSVAGNQVADATTAFFRGFSDLEAGLRDRLDEVTDILSADSTGFLMVNEPRPESIAECGPLAERLGAVGPVAGVVVNRVPHDGGYGIDERLDAIRSSVPGHEPVLLPRLGGGPVDTEFLDRLVESLPGAAPGGR